MPEFLSDPEVDFLRLSRGRAAVHKAQLILLRSQRPDSLVLVFEGDDDKIVYDRWITRVRPQLSYEPFPCGGKDKVIKLRETVERDTGDLNKNIYYFIDRDFDEEAEPHPKTFETDMYSVENYLVSPQVVEGILITEFHCNLQPEVRAGILALFVKLHYKFAEASKEVNFRIFAARRLNIKIVGGVTSDVRKLASISLMDVVSAATNPADVVGLEREIADEEKRQLQEVFEKLEPLSRFRGKFFFIFLNRWIDLLYDDFCKNDKSLLNPGREGRSRPRRSEITLGSLASRSPLPSGFPEFVNAI